MEFTHAQWVAVAETLGLDPESTVSINITPVWVHIVHADRPVTAQEVVAPPEGDEG